MATGVGEAAIHTHTHLQCTMVGPSVVFSLLRTSRTNPISDLGLSGTPKSGHAV